MARGWVRYGASQAVWSTHLRDDEMNIHGFTLICHFLFAGCFGRRIMPATEVGADLGKLLLH